MTVKLDADAPAFSENVAGLALMLSAVSLSLTVNVVVTFASPAAEAVIVTVAAPSTVLLSTAAIVAVAVVKSCTRPAGAEPPSTPTLTLILSCPELNGLDGARLTIAAGIATAAGTPVKTAAGATTAEIVLDADLGTNRCRAWHETAVPAF